MSVSNFILCVGDLYIPDRAMGIPEEFQSLFKHPRIKEVICLGNVTDTATHEYLKTIVPNNHPNSSANVIFVPGPYDNLFASRASPGSSHSGVIERGQLRIGYVNSTTISPPADQDSLLMAARQMDADVLLWGGTHKFDAFTNEDKFFINPGSLTGALSTGIWADGQEPVPSFVLLDVQGTVLTVFTYSLIPSKDGKEDQIHTVKTSFRKKVSIPTDIGTTE